MRAGPRERWFPSGGTSSDSSGSADRAACALSLGSSGCLRVVAGLTCGHVIDQRLGRRRLSALVVVECLRAAQVRPRSARRPRWLQQVLVSESVHEVDRERSCLRPDGLLRIFPVPEERLQILLRPVQPPGQSVQLAPTQPDRDPVDSISLFGVVGLQGVKSEIKRLRSERRPAQFDGFSGQRHTPRMGAASLGRQRPTESQRPGLAGGSLPSNVGRRPVQRRIGQRSPRCSPSLALFCEPAVRWPFPGACGSSDSFGQGLDPSCVPLGEAAGALGASRLTVAP